MWTNTKAFLLAAFYMTVAIAVGTLLLGLALLAFLSRVFRRLC